MQQFSWLSQTPIEKKPTPRPIPISKFSKHVESLYTKKGAMTGFEEEFNYLEAQCEHQYFLSYSSAHKPGNRGKNRYANVLPLEDSRVKLPILEGVNNSDYVNANYINGLVSSSTHAYISTQGPLETTLSDFWRLVWHENVHVILMLTKLVENDRAKCYRYFPQQKAKEPFEVEGFKIQLTKKEKIENSHLVVRTLELTDIKTEQTRKVMHLQYIEWPDHGLPSSSKTFRELMNLADESNKEGGPFVVHCSAGIGRTGTFCTVHSVIKKLLYDMEQLSKGISSENSQQPTESTTHKRSVSSGSSETHHAPSSSSTHVPELSMDSSDQMSSSSPMILSSSHLHGSVTECRETPEATTPTSCTLPPLPYLPTPIPNSIPSPVFTSSLARPASSVVSSLSPPISPHSPISAQPSTTCSPLPPPPPPSPALSTATPAPVLASPKPQEASGLHTVGGIAEPCIDILSAVLHMRKQRVGMVQTREQYEFCYLVLQEFLEDEQIINKFQQLKEEKTKASQMLSVS